jgi:hypothetical protein
MKHLGDAVEAYWKRWRPTKLEQMAIIASVSNPVESMRLAGHFLSHVAKEAALRMELEAIFGADGADELTTRFRWPRSEKGTEVGT